MTRIDWIKQDVNYLNSMNNLKNQFEELGDKQGLDKAISVINKTEESINRDTESMFSKSNFNKLISLDLSIYILERIKKTDFFKVQKSTGVLSDQLKSIINRKSKLTIETACAIQELTRIAISYNLK